jgi:Na+/proline symporter
MLMLGGTAVLTSLVKGLSPELAAMLLALVIGGYTLIGGLGATFYVCYFNTSLIFVLLLMLIVEVFYNPYDNPDNPFGSSGAIYEFVACWKAPEGNSQNSYMTFYSSGGLIFGIINIVGNFGAVFCDQAYWQSSVAAKPIQVRIGVIKNTIIIYGVSVGSLGIYIRWLDLVCYPFCYGYDHGVGLLRPIQCPRLPLADR